MPCAARKFPFSICITYKFPFETEYSITMLFPATFACLMPVHFKFSKPPSYVRNLSWERWNATSHPRLRLPSSLYAPSCILQTLLLEPSLDTPRSSDCEVHSIVKAGEAKLRANLSH